MAKKSIKIGQVVVIDPNDELNIRDRAGHIGIVIEKVTNDKSLLALYHDMDQKVTIMNKYLVPIEPVNSDLVLVTRSFPKVHFSQQDLYNIDRCMSTIEKLSSIDRYNKFAIVSTLKVLRSKIQRCM